MSFLRFLIIFCCIGALHAQIAYQQSDTTSHQNTETTGTDTAKSLNHKELLYICLDGDESACHALIEDSLPDVAECNEQASCIVIAHIYMNANQHEYALPYLQKSCQYGIKEACFEYALCHEVLGAYTNAFDSYKQSCDKGFMPSCYNLAMLYTQGLGVAQNIEKANRIFFETCANNEEQSCYNIAISYKHGIGVKADRLQAKHFFQKACELGMELGCKEYNIINAADFSITIDDHLKANKSDK